MKWNVIIKEDIQDRYEPNIFAGEPRIILSLDPEEKSLAIRNNVYEQILNKAINLPSAQVFDLLNLAISVYTADLKIPRKYGKERWTRNILLHLPVVGLAKWQALLPSLTKMLGFLTGDCWEINFREYEREHFNQLQIKNQVEEVNQVSLFSGGLDSLIGAIDLLEEGKRVALVGHYGAGITNKVQKDLLHKLEESYPNLIEPYLFYVQPPKLDSEGEGEPSMRSRSFLFFSLAVVVASLFPTEIPLCVAENGLISLNVPLTNSRVGSLSTRTTHPYFVSLYQELLSLLQLNITINLPYKFLTKGEMISRTKNINTLKQTVDLSMSCSHPEAGRYQGGNPNSHCGYCVPCLIRRASLAVVRLDDANQYNIDVLSHPPDPTSEKGRDLRAFQMAIGRNRFSSYNGALFDVLGTGEIPSDELRDYVEVYSRGMEEVREFLT
jgi:hypothetical protein